MGVYGVKVHMGGDEGEKCSKYHVWSSWENNINSNSCFILVSLLQKYCIFSYTMFNNWQLIKAYTFLECTTIIYTKPNTVSLSSNDAYFNRQGSSLDLHWILQGKGRSLCTVYKNSSKIRERDIRVWILK